MERPHRPPVGAPDDAARHETGPLGDPCAAVVERFGDPFEPRVARESHLGVEPEQVLLDRLDPPEVERLADGDLVGVASTAAQPGTADELVDDTPDRPQRPEPVPAAGAADAADDALHVGGVGRDLRRLRILVDGAAAPVRIPRLRCGRVVAGPDARPSGRDVEVLDACDRRLDRRAGRLGGVVGQAQCGVVGDDHVVAQAVDQRCGQPTGEWRHQVDPVRRERRTHERHRDDQTAPQTGRRRRRPRSGRRR